MHKFFVAAMLLCAPLSAPTVSAQTGTMQQGAHLEDQPASEKKPPVSAVQSPLPYAHQIDASLLECRIWLVLHVDVLDEVEGRSGTPRFLRFPVSDEQTVNRTGPSGPLGTNDPRPLPPRTGHLVFSLVHGPTHEVLGRLPRVPLDFDDATFGALGGDDPLHVGAVVEKINEWTGTYAKAFKDFSLVHETERASAFALMSSARSATTLSEFGKSEARRLVALALAGAQEKDMATRVRDLVSLPTQAKCIEQGIEASLFTRALNDVINRSINVAVLNNLDIFVRNLGNQAASDRKETVKELIKLVSADPELRDQLKAALQLSQVQNLPKAVQSNNGPKPIK